MLKWLTIFQFLFKIDFPNLSNKTFLNSFLYFPFYQIVSIKFSIFIPWSNNIDENKCITDASVEPLRYLLNYVTNLKENCNGLIGDMIASFSKHEWFGCIIESSPEGWRLAHLSVKVLHLSIWAGRFVKDPLRWMFDETLHDKQIKDKRI